VSTNYDFIAEQYKRAKLQPWRAHVESSRCWAWLVISRGKKVVDLACGEGFYSRILREHGRVLREQRPRCLFSDH